MRHKGLTRAGAAALVAAAAGLLAAAAGAGPAAFGDPAGDSGTAPDITNVAVSDTGAGGAISVGVTAAPLSAGGSIEVFLNTDKDDATGSPSGSELRLEVWQEADDWGWDIFRWASSDWQEVPESSSLHFSRSGSVFTWTFTRTDLGATNGFTLWAGGFMEDGDGNILARDEAPDGGDWVYDLPATKAVVLTVGEPLAVPAVPRAGKLLSLSFPITRSDTGAAPTGATFVVQTTIAGKPVPRVTSFANGATHVSVLLPKTSKGKTLRVKVTATLAGRATTKLVTFAIK